MQQKGEPLQKRLKSTGQVIQSIVPKILKKITKIRAVALQPFSEWFTLPLNKIFSFTLTKGVKVLLVKDGKGVS